MPLADGPRPGARPGRRRRRSRCPASTTPRWTATPPAGPRSPAPRGRRSGCPWPRTSPPAAPTSSRSRRAPCTRIMTGAPLPAGRRRRRPGRAHRRRHRRRRDPRRPRRRAATCGARARTSPRAPSRSPAGTPLGAAQLGLAAAVGATTLPVRRRPRVLRALHRQRARRARASRCGRARSTSRTPLLLAAAVEDAGGEARRLHFVPDDVDQFLATVRSRAGDGGPADHQRRRQRRRLRGGEGRLPRPGHRRVRQGRDAARRPAGRRHRGRRPGGDPARATRSAPSSPSRSSSGRRCAGRSGTPPPTGCTPPRG